MRNSIMFCLICLSAAFNLHAQNDIQGIKKTISSFSAAGDKYDTDLLDKCLDNNYRVVMNRLFGSTEVSVLSKETYLDKIKSHEFGGDQRTLTFGEIVVNGTSATAKVVFKGKKMTFTSLLTLLRDETGGWKLVSDVPVVS